MSWTNTRGVAGTAVKEVAHSDDAKRRTHDASRLRTPRPSWLAPVAVVVAVVAVAGAATAVGVSRSHGTTAGRSPGSQSGTSSGGSSNGGTSGSGTKAAPEAAPQRWTAKFGATPVTFTMACTATSCTISDVSANNGVFTLLFGRTFSGGGGVFRSSTRPLRTCKDLIEPFGSVGFSSITLAIRGDTATLSALSPAWSRTEGGNHCARSVFNQDFEATRIKG